MPADRSCVPHGAPPALPSTSHLRAYRIGTDEDATTSCTGRRIVHNMWLQAHRDGRILLFEIRSHHDRRQAYRQTRSASAGRPGSWTLAGGGFALNLIGIVIVTFAAMTLMPLFFCKEF